NSSEKLSPLQLHVQALRFTDRPSAAERLHGSPTELRERLDQLSSVRDDPGFESLPAAERDFVLSRAEELTEYLAYMDRLRHGRRPVDATREEMLREVRNDLTTSLALPHADWAPTEAGRAQQERLAECDALLAAVQKVRDWYLDRVE